MPVILPPAEAESSSLPEVNLPPTEGNNNIEGIEGEELVDPEEQKAKEMKAFFKDPTDYRI